MACAILCCLVCRANHTRACIGLLLLLFLLVPGVSATWPICRLRLIKLLVVGELMVLMS